LPPLRLSLRLDCHLHASHLSRYGGAPREASTLSRSAAPAPGARSDGATVSGALAHTGHARQEREQAPLLSAAAAPAVLEEEEAAAALELAYASPPPPPRSRTTAEEGKSKRQAGQ
jgi:hypothetical protein